MHATGPNRNSHKTAPATGARTGDLRWDATCHHLREWMLGTGPSERLLSKSSAFSRLVYTLWCNAMANPSLRIAGVRGTAAIIRPGQADRIEVTLQLADNFTPRLSVEEYLRTFVFSLFG